MRRKIHFYSIILFSLLCISDVHAGLYDLELGDLGKSGDYDQTIREFKGFFKDTSGFDAYAAGAIPPQYDWRDQGAVTLAKNQMMCGSCWAFASIGALESKILINEHTEWDISEQQMVSCSNPNYGCNGGRADAILYYYDQGPMEESCTGYTSGNGAYVPCTSLDQCTELPYRVEGYYTINTNDINEIKTSLYNDGPSYFRYNVYEDFYDFWRNGSPGQVYTQSAGGYEGGHAVLIIGWDDTKNAWLCKNSWGENAGPNGDGTFWIAYSGHANNLDFGMSNFSISGFTEPNKPPTANAGNDQTVKEEETVVLDGSASRDPDDGIAAFQWEQTGGASVNIDNVTSSQASFIAPNIESALTFKLTVTDQSGETDSDTCTVNIVPTSAPVLEVSPLVRNVSVASGTTTFYVQNTGTDDMNWTASVDDSWVMIENGSSGSNEGTITLRYQTNTGGARNAKLSVTAPSAKDSPKYVEIKQPSGTAGTFTFETMWPDSPYKFKWPEGIATDGEGNVYVADWGNGRIQKISSKGEILSKIDVNTLPSAVVLDNAENIYVGSYDGMIKKYDPSGTLIAEWGGKGTEDGKLQPGDSNGIEEIAIDDDGNVYVVDRFNHRIQKFSSEGVFISKWGLLGDGNGEFNEPCGIAIDTFGNIYVSERHNHRIQKFSPEGAFLTKWGVEGYWEDNEFSWAASVATDENNNVYVADRGTSIIKKFTSEGVFIKKWGGFGFDNGHFTYPNSIDVDEYGNVYVLDRRVQKFDLDGGFIDRWGSGFEDGDLSNPQGLALDSAENVYVVDGYERVQKFTKDGSFILKWGNSPDGHGMFSGPSGIAVDQNDNDNVYVIDTWFQRIQKFDAQGNFITMWGSKGKENGQFTNPVGIAVDKEGYVYVVDRWNPCVQKFSPNGDFIIKWGRMGNENGEFVNLVGIAIDNEGYVYTAESWNGNGVQVFNTDGEFISKWDDPKVWSGIAVDEDGNIYLTDVQNRIQKFTSDGQLIAGFGEGGFDAGQFNNPTYLTVSSSGRIFISDALNNRVQVFIENERASFNNISSNPVADAGTNQKVKEAETVTLDGSQSSDVDGTIAEFEWNQSSGPSITLYSTDTETPYFTAPDVNNNEVYLIFKLTVTDDFGLTDTATCVVEIIDTDYVDSDNDELSDDWEMAYFENLSTDAMDDPDGDGLVNIDEYQNGTHPLQNSLGDINRDSRLNLVDVITALQVVGGIQPAGVVNLVSDVNSDSQIGLEEAVYNLRQLSK